MVSAPYKIKNRNTTKFSDVKLRRMVQPALSEMSAPEMKLMSYYMNEDDGFTPASRLIFEYVGLEDRNMRKARAGLVDKGFLLIDETKHTITVNWGHLIKVSEAIVVLRSSTEEIKANTGMTPSKLFTSGKTHRPSPIADMRLEKVEKTFGVNSAFDIDEERDMDDANGRKKTVKKKFEEKDKFDFLMEMSVNDYTEMLNAMNRIRFADENMPEASVDQVVETITDQHKTAADERAFFMHLWDVDGMLDQSDYSNEPHPDEVPIPF